MSERFWMNKWREEESSRSFMLQYETSMLVLLIVGTKCPLAASRAAPGESRWLCRRDRQTDGRTDGRQRVTLRFPLDAASALSEHQRTKNFFYFQTALTSTSEDNIRSRL